MINFKAKCVGYTYVQKHNTQNKTKEVPVAFVKLRTSDRRDLDCFSKVAKNWETINPRCFAPDMFLELNDLKFLPERGGYNYEFYALTKQKSDFETLKPDSILGLIQIEREKPNSVEIAYIQTHPEFMHDNKNRRLKSIGKAMIEQIVKKFPNKDIIVNSISSAKSFYEALGFKSLSTIELILKRK